MPKSPHPNLRRKGAAFYFDTQEQPRRWIPLGSDQVLAMKRYHELVERKGKAGTVDRMVADYLAHLAAGGFSATGRKVTASTLAMYRTWSVHLSSVFGDLSPTEVTQGDVAIYLAQCQRTSARGEISLLSSAYGRAMIESELTFNPCIGARCGKPRAKRTRYITDAELLAVRAKAAPLLQVAMDLAYITGLRVSDLVSVRKDQFVEAGVIENLKTGVRQRFELTDDLRAVLTAARSLEGRIPSLFVLSGRGGQPLNRHTVGNWWRKACKAAGVAGVVWHDLRAKAGTDRDAEGGNAQEFLGHADPRTTRGYLRNRRISLVQPMKLRRG
jgi:integrase